MKMFKELIEEVYSSARYDNWSGQLIRAESEKVHETMKLALETFASILNNPTATPEERKWARDKIDALM